MRLVCLGDTHGRHKKIKDIPDGDVLIHAGDMTSCGSISDLCGFNKWLGKLPHCHKIIISGNHDWCFFRECVMARETITNAVYLEDSEVIIDGIKFYGSPWQPEFRNWAFNLPRGPKLAEVWDRIPDDTNVLITHSPSFGFLDVTENGKAVGCEDLTRRILHLENLKLHIFGHIHCMYGEKVDGDVHYINASICTEKYEAKNKPIVVDI